MARSYEEVVDTTYMSSDPNLNKFATALREQIQAEYQEIFGLGEVVARRREELNLSQVQLANQSGVTQADISRLEQGKGNPTFATVKKIMSALQLKIAVQRDDREIKGALRMTKPRHS